MGSAGLAEVVETGMICAAVVVVGLWSPVLVEVEVEAVVGEVEEVKEGEEEEEEEVGSPPIEVLRDTIVFFVFLGGVISRGGPSRLSWRRREERRVCSRA